MVENWNEGDEHNDSLSDPSLLDYEEDAEFCEWYSTGGSTRISELSRQLRTSLNYKSAVIRMRFSGERKSNVPLEQEPMMTLESDLYSFSSRYVTLLKMIGGEENMVTEKILILIERVKVYKKEFERNLLKEMKQLSDDTWKLVHVLSECELHQHSRLLNMAIKIAGMLCSAESAFSWTLSPFYEELGRSYRQLEEELSGLLRENEEMRLKAREQERRVRVLG